MCKFEKKKERRKRGGRGSSEGLRLDCDCLAVQWEDKEVSGSAEPAGALTTLGKGR